MTKVNTPVIRRFFSAPKPPKPVEPRPTDLSAAALRGAREQLAAEKDRVRELEERLQQALEQWEEGERESQKDSKNKGKQRKT